MIEITVPNSQDEISLGMYQRFAKIDGDTDFKARKMLQIFCGIDDVFKVPLADINEVSNIISKALNERQDELIRHFSLDGLRMGFIPNLSRMTYGEFVDLEGYIGDWDLMHKAMAVLYRPVIKESSGLYAIKDYEGTEGSEAYKKMPISVVFSAIVFFCRIARTISNHYLTELEKETKATNTQQGDSSLGLGVGMLRLMNLLTETLQNTKMSLNYPQQLVSLISPIEAKS